MPDVDPLTKVGIMVAIRQLAKENAGVKGKDGMAALEWALSRGIVAPRAGGFVAEKVDDLELTVQGEAVVVAFWKREEARKLMRRRRFAA